MPRSNFSRWIALISDYSRRGLHKDALHLFQQMMHGHGLRPDPFVLPSVLRACANLSDLKTGKILHSLITRSSFHSDAFVASALMHLYSKCGQLDSARKLFDRMPNKDLVVWNSMVSGYARQGLVDDAMALLKAMQSSGMKPDLLTWNALMSGYSQAGNNDMALHLFASMQVDGIKPDVFSWTSIISGLVRNFHYDKAFEMFTNMVGIAGVLPNSATISSILPACANVMNLRRGKEMHGYALVIGIEEDLFVSSSLVDMYAKCGMIFEAEVIFSKMRERNTISWNSMIFGYANNGDCDKAINLFFQMGDEGVKPDHLTFTAAFTACSHAGMVELGENLFDAMQIEHGILPRLEHCACMVDLLGRSGNLIEAYKFIKKMPVKPDSFVWGALLGACRTHGNMDLADIAASHLSELEPGSPGGSLLLSKILIDAGRWDDALHSKKLMKKRKLKRYQGCSWMQAG